MPGLVGFLSETSKDNLEMIDQEKPERMKLYLPSSIKTGTRDSVCTVQLMKIESELRHAQCYDALKGLRTQLRQRGYAGRVKRRQGGGQRYWLKSNTFLQQVNRRVKVYADMYKRARSAYLSLVGSGRWEQALQELKTEDIRGVSESLVREDEAETLKRTRLMAGLPETREEGETLENLPAIVPVDLLALGEGKRMLSWIWFTVSDEEMSDDSPGVVDSESIYALLYPLL
jgi:hypothetical protein